MQVRAFGLPAKAKDVRNPSNRNGAERPICSVSKQLRGMVGLRARRRQFANSRVVGIEPTTPSAEAVLQTRIKLPSPQHRKPNRRRDLQLLTPASVAQTKAGRDSTAAVGQLLASRQTGIRRKVPARSMIRDPSDGKYPGRSTSPLSRTVSSSTR